MIGQPQRIAGCPFYFQLARKESKFMVRKNRNAFSFLELVLIVAIVGILAAIAVPRLKFDTLGRYKADTIARKIVTDLRRTRSLAISNAATNSRGFELQLTGSSPYTGYKIVNRDTSATVDTFTIDIAVSVVSPSGTLVKFGPLGSILSGSSLQISVAAEGRTFTITIISATGTVKCVKS